MTDKWQPIEKATYSRLSDSTAWVCSDIYYKQGYDRGLSAQPPEKRVVVKSEDGSERLQITVEDFVKDFELKSLPPAPEKINNN